MWYRNIGSMFFRLVTKHACDGRTVGQNYDSQDRASIAASRGKNHSTLVWAPRRRTPCISSSNLPRWTLRYFAIFSDSSYIRFHNTLALPEDRQRHIMTVAELCIYSAKSSWNSNVYSCIDLGMIHWIHSGCVMWFRQSWEDVAPNSNFSKTSGIVLNESSYEAHIRAAD